jgi:hypothetical protein
MEIPLGPRAPPRFGLRIQRTTATAATTALDTAAAAATIAAAELQMALHSEASAREWLQSIKAAIASTKPPKVGRVTSPLPPGGPLEVSPPTAVDSSSNSVNSCSRPAMPAAAVTPDLMAAIKLRSSAKLNSSSSSNDSGAAAAASGSGDLFAAIKARNSQNTAADGSSDAAAASPRQHSRSQSCNATSSSTSSNSIKPRSPPPPPPLPPPQELIGNSYRSNGSSGGLPSPAAAAVAPMKHARAASSNTDMLAAIKARRAAQE